jgi:hypothetical protein
VGFGLAAHLFRFKHRHFLFTHGPPDDPTDELELVQSETHLE